MRVFMTGATGFIGRALILRLRRDGHEVRAWVRDEARARSLLGTEAELAGAGGGDEAMRDALEGCEGIVNLAGEPILGGRWTRQRKEALRTSRVDVTAQIVQAIGSLATPPKVLVSGSAVGWYGDRGDDVLLEDARPGDDFLAELCRAWEDAAGAAAEKGVRVAIIRTGVVFGREGGALEKMLPPFRFGAGGPIAGGAQYTPWIHLEDLVEMFATALVDERWSGAFNGTAPKPVTNAELSAAIGRALHRPVKLPVPAIALKAIFGDAASVLVASQRAVPDRAEKLGFQFRFRTVDAALADILDDSRVHIEPIAEDGHASGATHVLETSTTLDMPLARVYDFFSRPENLGLITPAAMRFVIEGAPDAMNEGAEIRYRLRVGPVPIRWKTRIEEWHPGSSFVDSQEAGPYRAWWHEHRFREEGGKTVMEDRVYYAPPLGLLGRFANRVFVSRALRQIFGYRAQVIRLRFGGAG